MRIRTLCVFVLMALAAKDGVPQIRTYPIDIYATVVVGGGGGTLSYATFTNSDYATMDNSQYAGMTN